MGIKISVSTNQRVTLEDYQPISNITFYSLIGGSSYQWYEDGGTLTGKTSANLGFATFGTGDLGTYQCQSNTSTSWSFVVEATGYEKIYVNRTGTYSVGYRGRGRTAARDALLVCGRS